MCILRRACAIVPCQKNALLIIFLDRNVETRASADQADYHAIMYVQVNAGRYPALSAACSLSIMTCDGQGAHRGMISN